MSLFLSLSLILFLRKFNISLSFSDSVITRVYYTFGGWFVIHVFLLSYYNIASVSLAMSLSLSNSHYTYSIHVDNLNNMRHALDWGECDGENIDRSGKERKGRGSQSRFKRSADCRVALHLNSSRSTAGSIEHDCRDPRLCVSCMIALVHSQPAGELSGSMRGSARRRLFLRIKVYSLASLASVLPLLASLR